VDIVKRSLTALAALAALAFNAFPCSVPVFRYALELWPQDSYRVAVLFKDRLDSKQSERVRWIASHAASVTGDTAGLGTVRPAGDKANVELVLVNVKDSVDSQTARLWGGGPNPDLPWCTVLFPRRSMNPSALYGGPLFNAPLQAMFDSPARRAITSALLGGESAVWVFIGSGNVRKDAAALKTLSDEIDQCKKTLTLPDLEASDVKKVVTLSNVELKIDFSLVVVSRLDPRERCFIDQLEKTEPQLAKLRQQPIACPVFARGRVLYALVGKGINAQNIHEASSFLTGPCACTVKDQNPGTDILMTFDWVAALSGKATIQQHAMPLTGIDAFIATGRSSTARQKASGTFGEAPRSTALALAGFAAAASASTVPPRDSPLQNNNNPPKGLIVRTAPESGNPSHSEKSLGPIVVPMLGGGFGIGALILVSATVLIGRKRGKNS
jgi:hypothetical protein